MPLIRSLLLLLLSLLSPSSYSDIVVQDHNANECQIEVLAAEGELLTLWFNDLVEEERPHFTSLMKSLQQSGIEVWSTRVLQDLFLTRDDPSIMSLDGSKIAAIIDAVQQKTEKQILLLSYDKMSIPLLRGVRYWQQHYSNNGRVSGVALLYPNLFIVPSRAGEQPTPAPILSFTNVPVTLFQPAQGQHAKRIGQAMEKLWEAGSAATLFPLANIRDWYLMHKPGQYPAEAAVRAQLPHHLEMISKQMQFSPFPEAPLPQKQATTIAVEKDPSRLIPVPKQPTAPNFTLQDLNTNQQSLDSLKGKVVLVNFWASWCPPCIEELPSMNRIYQRYRDQGLEILAINFQEQPEEIADFMKKVKIDFPVLFDQEGAVADQWNVFSMPTSFLINREGKMVYSVGRSIHWDLPESIAILDQLVAESGEP
ncbi:MAG: TlpA family protein disulfide reductase [Gammaproteobacteria bacterium]|jgi:thiol-disulfide isomerase/thioredoxin|nr:TlpA family protein disulfide reductase [Gammaproteobacteria bacterium]MBT4606253.1 TlpA family protein disulfide reductase [Thiotrichales bacterium]MBT5636887.1 TlpA family protein disulfide reductase [Gammaproteobacteria bacterium]MBT6669963.1 TlpA family protein disulfide reductase [Gammaproteobacteria bacterium]